jgi:hypothetical protein
LTFSLLNYYAGEADIQTSHAELLRKVFVVHGLSNGLAQFMPLLIGMIVFNNEGILGNISLISSLVTMMVLAWWGKGAKINQRTTAVITGAFVMALGSIAVAFYPTGVMAYKILYSVGSSIFYGIEPSLIIEKDEKRPWIFLFLDESIFEYRAGDQDRFVLSLAWNSPNAALIAHRSSPVGCSLSI